MCSITVTLLRAAALLLVQIGKIRVLSNNYIYYVLTDNFILKISTIRKRFPSQRS